MQVTFPNDVTHALLHMGIRQAIGKIYYRNLVIKKDGVAIPLGAFTNMGFADEVAGDYKGGWHDQGSDSDAAKFPVNNLTFANVPFSVIDPKKNNGKSIIVFKSPKLPNGVEEAGISLKYPVKGKFLYLLHTSAWGDKKEKTVGTIEVVGEDGRNVFPVVLGKDIADWWKPKSIENAVIGVQISANKGIGGAYVSRFEIPQTIGAVKRIVFRKNDNSQTMWILIGATITEMSYKYPDMKKLVMKADNVWKALPQKYISAPKAGTALDLSALFEQKEVGAHGRVVIRNGHFEFENKPGEQVRFTSVGLGRGFATFFGMKCELSDKERIEEFADQIQRCGYNMIRFWALEMRNIGWENLKAFEFNESVRDRADYLFYCLKKRGVYVFLSIGIPFIGFDNAYPWDKKLVKKWSLYSNQKDYADWCKSTKSILNHVNPYTKMRWIDDPIISMIDCNNEQEFAFIRADKRYDSLFQKFLEHKYKNIAALKTDWGKDGVGLNNFADIVNFTPLGTDESGQKNLDKAEFITKEETNLYKRERAYLREIGYKGPVTTFLMGKSMRHDLVRKDFDFVAQNGYHAHPFGAQPAKGGTISQGSSIGSAANTIRSFLAVRLYDKPFLISEHGHVFWNKYRYEQGFIMGAYSALNDFDALNGFFMQITTYPNHRILPFEMRYDPIARASELMTNLLYRRKDIKTSKIKTRIQISSDEIRKKDNSTIGVNATQLKLGLIGQCYIDLTNKKATADEFVLKSVGGSTTSVRSADSNVVDIMISLLT